MAQQLVTDLRVQSKLGFRVYLGLKVWDFGFGFQVWGGSGEAY